MSITEQEPIQGTATARPWHSASPDEALARLGVGRDGLDEAAVERLRAEHGANTLPRSEPPTLFAIIVRQFINPLIAILIVAAIVSIFVGEIEDSVFIIIVILLNAVLGTYQEYRAEQSAAALQNLMTMQARVRRDGLVRSIEAEELVPGDLVLLESGDRVPSDLRLLSTNNLRVDESFLTGESEAVNKKATAEIAPEAPVSDRLTMTFTGATVVAGRGEGMVVATGQRTEIGAIATAAAEGSGLRPPLVIRMERFVNAVSIVVLASSALLVIISMAQGTPFIEIFFLAVALAVSAIPEGLPIAMTVALSIAVRRMAQRQVIVRKMTAVEALGSCTIIASDKTGTLTVNRQTIRTLLLPDGQRYEVTGEGYAGEGDVRGVEGAASEENVEQLRALGVAGVHSNEAHLRPANEGEWEHDGDAVDVAFLALGYKLGTEPEPTRDAVEVLERIPYESERQYAAAVYRDDGALARVAVKGAAERVLAFCAQELTAAGPRPLNRERALAQAEQLAEEGYRVLAVAIGELDGATDGFDEAAMPPLTLLGIAGMIDPLRSEAREAVEDLPPCRGRGGHNHWRPPGHRAGDRARSGHCAFAGGSSDGARPTRRHRPGRRRALYRADAQSARLCAGDAAPEAASGRGAERPRPLCRRHRRRGERRASAARGQHRRGDGLGHRRGQGHRRDHRQRRQLRLDRAWDRRGALRLR